MGRGGATPEPDTRLVRCPEQGRYNCFSSDRSESATRQANEMSAELQFLNLLLEQLSRLDENSEKGNDC